MADPITAIIALAIKVGTAIVVAYKASIVVRAIILIAAVVAINFVAKALSKKGAASIDQGQELTLKLDPTMPRQVVLGRTSTGGSQAWAFTYTDDVNVPNKYLVRVIVLSDRPIEGVVNVMEGTEALTFASDIYSTMAPCNQHLKDTTPYMWMHVEKGSDDAVAKDWLITASGGKWTTGHKGQGLAYAIVSYSYDADAFPDGEPQLSFIVDGVKCYDDRESVVNGGAQDLSDPTTWAYSRNPAILMAQYLRGFRTKGSLLVGSQADERDLDPDMIVAAANTCDQEVALLSGLTEPRYQAGMLGTSANSVQTDINEFRLAMDGMVYDRSGQITIFPGGTRTSVMDITDEDVNWAEEKSYQPIASLDALYNTVQGSYVPESQYFTEEPYSIKHDDTYQAADGGERIVLNQDYKAVTSDTQVQRITTRLLEASRFQITIGFTGPLWLFEMEQGDWFTMTSARWGFTSKLFIVQVITITADLKVSVVAIETSSTIDNWSPADEVPRTTTQTLGPGYSLPVPVLVCTPLAYTTSDGVEIPVIEYDITIPSGSAAENFQMEVQRIGDATPFQVPSVPAATEATGLITQSLLPKTDYQVRARSSDGRLASDWCTWVPVTTTDTLTASNTILLGGRTAAEWIADLAAATDAANEAFALASAITDEITLTSEGLIQLAMAATDDRAYQDALSYLSSVPIGTVLLNEVQNRIDGDTALVQTISLIGAKSGDSLSFILDISTVKVSPTESLATRLTSLNAADGANAALISTESSARVSGDTSISTELHLLGAQNGGGTAFVINQTTTQIGGGESLATRLNSLSAADSGNAANLVSEQTARANGDSANASSITSLQTTVNGHTSTITTLQSSVNGVLAKYSLTLDVNGHITGFIANNNGITGTFIIVTDDFAVVGPGVSPTVPFAIVAGQIHMTNVIADNIAANSIDAAQIRVGIITADKIVGGAISGVSQAGTNNGGSPVSTSVLSHTHTYTSEGGAHVISLNYSVGQTGSGVSGVTADLYNRETGAHLGQGAVAFAGPFALTIPFTVFDHPGAGTWHYDVYLAKTSGSTGVTAANNANTVITELKR